MQPSVNFFDGVRAIIFDCDGTLVDSGPLYLRAWEAGFATVGSKMDKNWYKKRSGLSESALIEQFEALHQIEVDRSAIVPAMRAEFTANAAYLREIEHVASIARAAFGVFPIAVASGGPGSLVRLSLEMIGLEALFDVVVTFEDVNIGKPKPDLFLEAARRLGVSPTECLVLEDSATGLTAAAKANMRSVDVRDENECAALASQLNSFRKRRAT